MIQKNRYQLPGNISFSDTEQKLFDEMIIKKGENYRPRTKHLLPNGKAKYINHLFLETSPYLLQHAHNPVNWYPWGNQAFQIAENLNRPVLLSVGYSTCHWCHVMEVESFEDEEIAKFLNENYIAIKVDREERPDVDALYMSAVQLMIGSGGWPMTVWLTSDKKPFFGGTYFPARDGDRSQRIGFYTLLNRALKYFHHEKQKLDESSSNLVKMINQKLNPLGGTELPLKDSLNKAIKFFKERFDYQYGGLKWTPKFPRSLPIRFLLRYFHRTKDNDVFHMITLTLDQMMRGGLYDQIGGGFHRYSTDEKWLVPHFEKMLYDNALWLVDYVEAYQLTKNKNYQKIIKEVLGYLDREMRSNRGGYYSATDADSVTSSGERKEGYYFTWTIEEIEHILGKEKVLIFNEYFGVTEAGNFGGRNILFHQLEENISSNYQDEKLEKILEESKSDLLKFRLQRQAPLRDEKIIVAWNALMISALTKCGFVLHEDQYIQKAVETAQFILDQLFDQNEKILYRIFNEGKRVHWGVLEDYAFFIAALIDLFEVTGQISYFEHAMAFDKILYEQFEDNNKGGFFKTSLRSLEKEKFIAREKPNYDGAEPCGNSVQIMNLLRLAHLNQNKFYQDRLENAFIYFSSLINSKPMALSEMLIALEFYFSEVKQIVYVHREGINNEKEKLNLLDPLRNTFVPHKILINCQSHWSEKAEFQTLLPLIQGRSKIPVESEQNEIVYLCNNHHCLSPISHPIKFLESLNN